MKGRGKVQRDYRILKKKEITPAGWEEACQIGEVSGNSCRLRYLDYFRLKKKYNPEPKPMREKDLRRKEGHTVRHTVRSRCKGCNRKSQK